MYLCVYTCVGVNSNIFRYHGIDLKKYLIVSPKKFLTLEFLLELWAGLNVSLYFLSHVIHLYSFCAHEIYFLQAKLLYVPDNSYSCNSTAMVEKTFQCTLLVKSIFLIMKIMPIDACV